MAAPRYRLSSRAHADLDAIVNYLAEHNVDAARSVLVELRSTFQLLAANPQIGTSRADLHPKVQLFTPARPASNYVVFYYQFADGIEISDVIHAARDWEGMFSRGER